MASNSGSNPPYAPSAPPAPGSDQPRMAYPYQPPPNPSSPYAPVTHTSHTHSSPTPPPPNHSSPYAPVTHTGHYQHSSSASYGPGPAPQGYGYNPYQHQPQQHNVYSSFPPGTHPDVIRSFQMVDRNQNGYIEETELGEALTWNYQKFSRRTLRFLIFLFRNPRESSRIGPKEFSEIWSCLGQWRGIFERFDRDRSGKIDSMELRDALYSLGYAVPPPVLQVLISRYEDGSGRRVELSFDSFVECGMIIKGLTEKFKEKDPRYTGSATLSYDTFMSMIIPFLVSE